MLSNLEEAGPVRPIAELTVPLEEVAAALGLSPERLRRLARSLHEKHGFPLPLPTAGWRWSRPVLQAWLEAGGAPLAPEDAPDLPKLQNAMLRRKYGARP